MTWVSSGTTALTNGDSQANISHGIGGSHDGQRSVLAIVIPDTRTVSSILVFPGGAAGGWTLFGTYAAQGRKWWLYDKICGPSEPQTYTVTLSGAVSDFNFMWLTDFATQGAAIRAASYADGAAGSTLTLPSLTAVRADDLYSVAWGEDADGKQLRPDSPLTRIGAGATQAIWHSEHARQVWQSSSATGTRSYTMTDSGTFDKAVAAMILVGEIPAVGGGWGVGSVRMGAS
jgi:hypothetical protein